MAVKKKEIIKKETIIKEVNPKSNLPTRQYIPVQEKRINPPAQKKSAGTDVEKMLVENFVSLQKVMTNLAVKFDNLSDQISKLLGLFEISAKTLAEKGATGEDKKMLEKLDSLLDQNKVIAKGIALLHERAMPAEQEVEIVSSESVSPISERPMPIPRLPSPRIPPGHKIVKTVETERILKPSQLEFPENRKRFVTEA